jgi:hypothetical protein
MQAGGVIFATLLSVAIHALDKNDHLFITTPRSVVIPTNDAVDNANFTLADLPSPEREHALSAMRMNVLPRGTGQSPLLSGRVACYPKAT